MNDIIAAISTPPGEGGIGIVRISGGGSSDLLSRVFRAVAPLEPDATSFAGRHMYYGHVIDSEGVVVDEALAVFMAGPRTYTGEDIAELHCHGSVAALRKALSLFLREGARLAEPGEFTKRAFLSGRVDLAQAEAVIDIINAKTDIALNAAVRQLDGFLSARVRELRGSLTELLAEIAVSLDYPEEDDGGETRKISFNSLSLISDNIEKLLISAHSGRIVREGLHTVIAGTPNVGKSSLMNALLREQRAIVTEIPCTTRDLIEETADIRGIAVKLADTAGLRPASEPIEAMGVGKSREAIESADLVLLVLDGSSPIDDDDRLAIRSVGKRPVIALLNKADLPQRFNVPSLSELLPDAALMRASVKTGEGIEELEAGIESFVYQGRAVPGESPAVTNVRHVDLLERAAVEIRESLEAVSRREAPDLTEIGIRRAWELLGEITGETVGSDIVNEIFSRFCVGK